MHNSFCLPVRHVFVSLLTLALCACGGPNKVGDTVATSNNVSASVSKLSAAALVGQKIFFDQNLSGSGKMSCATCHDPNFAYGPPNKLAVQLGGIALDQPGSRAAPSLRYKDVTPAYADLLDNPDGISAPGPGGGFTQDGRVDSLAAQAAIPLLNAAEMANASGDAVVAKLKTASYAALFTAAFGTDAFADSKAAFNNATLALQAFQLEDSSFHPYSSKFDLHASNKLGGTFSAAEARGLKIFSDPNTGNCASCHYQGAGREGSSGLFTDFSYAAIGVPRNRANAVNLDPSFIDEGICGPFRRDHLPATANSANAYCGMFKTPTLRNVSTRQVFFHNGVLTSLLQVLQFYNTRDTNPEIWYPTIGGTALKTPSANFPNYGLITTQYSGGTVSKYDDLPARYRANIDTQLPLDGRKAGSKPPMSDQDLADLACFLGTLNDGYQAGSPTNNAACQ
ncbi:MULTISPECIES: cytochrome-c peroxidase [unclassified Undibacterium]|uniref:cytochrome-c peroxidase n=1 Tax=unclassified Undibacterium TaxID=2630295 RepID=UPI002AC8E536|nr:MULTISPECIES: cytochrome c peroxidase [unclassified Undibacterium]MEB0140108.1 cytochrome c peroxidase [Undibacterium sp. CCC2.1]MEB0173218.1 cytochrome c peroxidase [Undibacterium sp. CCC1.1]MEB0176921.1 cytochrome c peroxidase [Undibacterium sp. CCC3.4]MEB0216254.1 cytochrome c peroxidase [Undibacterium sp. 5I2]WPX44158.1 cytochrome c peroxidase [Undibacterium sp. CCC3.4]